MEIVQQALSERPVGCIKFYGLTTLSSIGDLKSETLCLVFERATEGTVVDYIQRKGNTLSWYEFVSLFITVGEALDNGLHRKNIVHRCITSMKVTDDEGSSC